jgi:limonene 1,2-monooxygenase
LADEQDAGMKFGVFMSPVHAPQYNPTLVLERDIQRIIDLERLGFDEVWVGEHHSTGWEYVGSPELIIANVLPRTQRIRLGTGVISIPYHSPFMVAERMMLLDHLSRGRVTLGLGPGALPYDAHMLGIDVMDSRRRLEEGIDVVLRLFRGEAVTRDADWFTLNDARLQLSPYGPHHMEVAVSATASPNGPKLAGKYGTSLLSFNATGPGAFEALAGRWELVEEEAALHGQTVDRRGWRLVAPMMLAETEEQAIREVRHGLEKWLYYMTDVSGLLPKDADALLPADIGEASNVDATAQALIAAGFAVIGTPAQAIEKIQIMIEQTGGFGSMLIWDTDWSTPEAMHRSYELFAQEVIPAIRGSVRSLKENEAWVQAQHGEITERDVKAKERAIHDYALERSARQGPSS